MKLEIDLEAKTIKPIGSIKADELEVVLKKMFGKELKDYTLLVNVEPIIEYPPIIIPYYPTYPTYPTYTVLTTTSNKTAKD